MVSCDNDEPTKTMIPESVTSETESELNQYIEDLSSIIVEQTITESTTPEVDSMLPDTYEKNDQDESSSVKTSNSEELVILTKNDIQDLEQTQMDMSSLAQNELDPSENITNLASYNSFNKKVQEIEVSISEQENTEASLQLGVATQEFKSSYNNLHDELKSESSIPKTPFTTSYNTGLAKKVDEHETLLPQEEYKHHNLKGKITSETNNNTMSVNSSPSSASQLMGSASEGEENLIELQEATPTVSKSSISSSISQKSKKNSMRCQLEHIVSWTDPKLSGSYFGAIMFVIYLLKKYPLLYIFSNIGLMVITTSIFVKVYAKIISVVKSQEINDPFAKYLKVNDHIPLKSTTKVVDSCVSCFNENLTVFFALLLCKDTKATMKFASCLYVFSKLATWMTLLTLIQWTVIFGFTLPKFYEMNQTVIDCQIATLEKIWFDAYAKAEAMFPKLKRE